MKNTDLKSNVLTNKQRSTILLTIMTGAFITVLAQTVLTSALPSIMSDFNVSANTGQWLTTIYMLVIWFPMELFICGKILFRKKDMNWGKTAHGLVLEEQDRLAAEENEKEDKELQEV